MSGITIISILDKFLVLKLLDNPLRMSPGLVMTDLPPASGGRKQWRLKIRDRGDGDIRLVVVRMQNKDAFSLMLSGGT